MVYSAVGKHLLECINCVYTVHCHALPQLYVLYINQITIDAAGNIVVHLFFFGTIAEVPNAVCPSKSLCFLIISYNSTGSERWHLTGTYLLVCSLFVQTPVAAVTTLLHLTPVLPMYFLGTHSQKKH